MNIANITIYQRYLTRFYLKQYIERYIVRAIVLFLGKISFPVNDISFPLCDITFPLHDKSFLLSEISFQFIVLALRNTRTLLQTSFTIMTIPLCYEVSSLRWQVAS